MRLFKLAAACGLAVLFAAPGVWAQRNPGPLTPALLNPAELVFTPIPPCRAFVTRAAVAANQERTFTVVGRSYEFTAQGGPAAGCGVPASATAVAISFTSFGSTGTGYLRASAFGDPVVSTTQVLSFGNNVTVTAGAITALGDGKITLRSYTAATKVVGDVTGYYAPPIRAVVAANGDVLSKTSRILYVSKDTTFNGVYRVVVDRPVNQCTVSGSASSFGTIAYFDPLYMETESISVFIYSIKGPQILENGGFSIVIGC